MRSIGFLPAFLTAGGNQIISRKPLLKPAKSLRFNSLLNTRPARRTLAREVHSDSFAVGNLTWKEVRNPL